MGQIRVQKGLAFRSKPPSFQRKEETLKGNSTRPRWANSGVVIGPVPAMRELYKELVEILRDPQNTLHGDQGNPLPQFSLRSFFVVTLLYIINRLC
jgi:hypothetical protein